VTEPVRSQIPQTSRRFSGPELTSRAPEVVETPIVIDPYEDTDSLRLKARNEGSRMEECFKLSREAFARNERALAKQLSLKGEAHKANMVRLDKEASTKIFRENNQGHMSDRVDLHGLFVSEAKVYFSNAVRRAQNSGESLLYVIVGRGNHSENNIARIKPAIQEYGQSVGLDVEVDPLNNGCLVVSLDPS
jgi:DNA-nicking Smr family endonuclease